MSNYNFMLSWVEDEKFYNPGAYRSSYLCQAFRSLKQFCHLRFQLIKAEKV